MAGVVSVVLPGIIAYVSSRRIGVTAAVLVGAASLNVAARSLAPATRATLLLVQFLVTFTGVLGWIMLRYVKRRLIDNIAWPPKLRLGLSVWLYLQVHAGWARGAMV